MSIRRLGVRENEKALEGSGRNTILNKKLGINPYCYSIDGKDSEPGDRHTYLLLSSWK